MNITDIFNVDLFDTVSMTETVEILPLQPTRIGSMGLFMESGITTPTFSLTLERGRLRLIPTSSRGSETQFNKTRLKKAKIFEVPHLEQGDTITADELIGRREFGNTLMTNTDATVGAVMNEKMQQCKDDHALTWEWQMLGAIKGVVLDADGEDIIYDWFDEFGITKKEITYTTDLAQVCRDVKRHIGKSLGSLDTNRPIKCLVGEQFMDRIASDPTVKDDYSRWMDGDRLRTNAARSTFVYQGVEFEEYLGFFDDDTPFIDVDKGHCFPMGTNRFIRKNAPADMLEAVGTMGKQIYSWHEIQRGNKGIDICTQSNPLIICTQPELLVELTVG